MPLKAPELHKLAREELGPTLTALGFRRTPKVSVASWCRAEGERWLVMWFQPSMYNDAYSAGYRFAVEFALSREPRIAGGAYRERLPSLLSDKEREELRQMENRTIAKLPPPNAAFAKLLDPQTREHWLGGWKPRKKAFGPKEDVWFRHGDESDVRQLMIFFRRALPAVIERFLDAAAAQNEADTN